jgi:hypothetical protein
MTKIIDAINYKLELPGRNNEDKRDDEDCADDDDDDHDDDDENCVFSLG